MQLQQQPPHTVTVELPSIYDSPDHSFQVKCCIFVDQWRGCIMITGLSLLAAIIATIIVINQSGTTTSTSSNPCAAYHADDLASSVTIACFQTIWANAGCKSAIPAGYAGWFLRSPQGGKTILCLTGMADADCGAGSYGTILNTVYTCDLGYRGH